MPLPADACLHTITRSRETWRVERAYEAAQALPACPSLLGSKRMFQVPGLGKGQEEHRRDVPEQGLMFEGHRHAADMNK